MVAGSVSHKLKLAGRKFSPRHISRQLRTARIVRTFAESAGLVYFGTVARDRRGHADIKGFTLSNTHFDRHLSVGSLKGYDVALAVRRDSVSVRGVLHDFAWTILKVDLHNRNDLAPLVIADTNMLPVYHSKFMNLQPLPPLDVSAITQQFSNRFSVFGNIARHDVTYDFLDATMMSGLLFQAQQFSVELAGNELLVYIPAKFPTKKELTWLINFGIWLAQSIDSK